MCVIACVFDPEKRPSPDQVKAMWDANPYGGGVGWQEDGSVRWHKGLSLEEMINYAARLPVPHILHFRIPSTGGDREELCHPFIIDKASTLSMEGHSKSKQILFHNGTWSDWKSSSKLWLGSAAGKIKAVPGPWSDSRAMAFWAWYFGTGIFDGGKDSPWGIDEKIAILGPTGEIQVFGNGWSEVDGFVVSNEGWKFRWRKEEKKEKKENKSDESYHTSAPHSMFHNYPHKREEATTIELVRVEQAAKKEESEVSSKQVHPFRAALERYETAMIAYMLWMPGDGVDRVSKNKVKDLKRKFIKACCKYPDMARPYLSRELNTRGKKAGIQFAQTTELAKTMQAWEIFEMSRKEAKANISRVAKELSDLGQAVPQSVN